MGKLAAALGTPLMPWQQQVADVALEVDENGEWIYRTIIVTVQRQAGKTTLVGPVSLHRCLTRPDVMTWLTAQRRQDARDTWTEIAKRVRRSALNSRVKVRESNGSESLTFPNGSTFRPFAPSEESLHGKANELVTIDEGWAFSALKGAALEAAIVPTFTTTGGQLWIVSTAGTAESEWLRGFVERGRAAVDAGRRDTVAFFEWSLPEDAVPLVSAGLAEDATEQLREDAFRAVLDAHPAAGHTLRLDALRQAAATMSTGEFLRAYGNVWTSADERVVPAHLWDACRADGWPRPARLALAFDVAVDRSSAAIGAAWRGEDGRLYVDTVEQRAGDKWLVPMVRELVEKWRPAVLSWPGAGPAADVADELRRAGLDVAGMTAGEYAAACASFLSGVRNDQLRHPGHPALDLAVAAAARRELGDGGWAWSRRKSAASIAPLTAATAAAWTWDHRPAPAAAPVVRSRPRQDGARVVRRR